MRLQRCLPLLVVVSVLGVSASAAQTSRTGTAPHATIEMLSASASLEAGADTWIGVRFLLEPGWHLYWRNPGDSGTPPMLLWTAPAGVTVGDVEWPAPERIPLGSLVNYGYHGDVILPVRVRAASRVEGPVALNASWLVCKDVCVQGKARLAVTFPLQGMAAAATTNWATTIAEARRRVPAALPKGWTAKATVTATGFDIDIAAPKPLVSPLFFSIDEGVIEEAAAPVVTPTARGTRLSLKKSELLTTTPTVLHGVLTLGDGKSYNLVMRLAAPAARPRSPR